MNHHANTSLGIFLTGQDHVVALAGYRNIASRALGLAIFAAQSVIRQEQQQLDDALAGKDRSDLDARNELDITTGTHNGFADSDDQDGVEASRTGREPPVGIEPLPTPQERLTAAASIYVSALERCQKLATNQYDLPQDLASRMDWTKTRAAEAMKTRPVAFNSTAEKLAFAARVSQAQRDHEFWRDHGEDVQALVEEALDYAQRNREDDLDALDLLEGVEAHQYAIQAGIGVQSSRVRLEIALQRFPPHTMIGRNMISDLGALELSLPKIKDFIDLLESTYAGEIQSAVMAGRNLLSTESVDAGYNAAVDRAVDRAVGTQNQFKSEEART